MMLESRKPGKKGDKERQGAGSVAGGGGRGARGEGRGRERELGTYTENRGCVRPCKRGQRESEGCREGGAVGRCEEGTRKRRRRRRRRRRWRSAPRALFMLPGNRRTYRTAAIRDLRSPSPSPPAPIILCYRCKLLNLCGSRARAQMSGHGKSLAKDPIHSIVRPVYLCPVSTLPLLFNYNKVLDGCIVAKEFA
jgi:hypothetical protein